MGDHADDAVDYFMAGGVRVGSAYTTSWGGHNRRRDRVHGPAPPEEFA